MHRYKLYNLDEIENLKKELDIYRNALETLKLGDLVENYLKAQSEVYRLTYKGLKLEGDIKAMKENFQETIEKYNQEERELSAQIKVMNDSLIQLIQDMNWVKDKVEQMQTMEIPEIKNQTIHQQEEKVNNEKSEIDILREEISQLKEQITPNQVKQDRDMINTSEAPKQSEYKQLQNMLQSSNIMESTQPNKNNMIPSQNLMRSMSSTSIPSYNQNSIRINNGKKNNSQLDLKSKTILHSKKKNRKQKELTNTNSSVELDSNTTTNVDNISMPKDAEENNANKIEIEALSETPTEKNDKPEENQNVFKNSSSDMISSEGPETNIQTDGIDQKEETNRINLNTETDSIMQTENPDKLNVDKNQHVPPNSSSKLSSSEVPVSNSQTDARMDEKVETDRINLKTQTNSITHKEHTNIQNENNDFPQNSSSDLPSSEVPETNIQTDGIDQKAETNHNGLDTKTYYVTQTQNIKKQDEHQEDLQNSSSNIPGNTMPENNLQAEETDKDMNQHNQANKKTDFSSFFSFFKKKV